MVMEVEKLEIDDTEKKEKERKQKLLLVDLSIHAMNVLMLLGAFLLLLSNFFSIFCLATVNSLTPIISAYYYNGTTPALSGKTIIPDTDWVTWTLAFGFVAQFFLVFLGTFAAFFGFGVVHTTKACNRIVSTILVFLGSIFVNFVSSFYYSIFVIVVVKGSVLMIVLSLIVFCLAGSGIVSLLGCQFTYSIFGFLQCFAFLFKCFSRDSIGGFELDSATDENAKIVWVKPLLKEPIVVTLLNILQPGLGHIALGQWKKGFGIAAFSLVANTIAITLCAFLVGFLIIPFVMLFDSPIVLYDGWTMASRSKKGYPILEGECATKYIKMPSSLFCSPVFLNTNEDECPKEWLEKINEFEQSK
eukprot:gene9450-1656_t